MEVIGSLGKDDYQEIVDVEDFGSDHYVLTVRTSALKSEKITARTYVEV